MAIFFDHHLFDDITKCSKVLTLREGEEDCVWKSLRSGYEGWDDYFCEFSETTYMGIHALCMMEDAA